MILILSKPDCIVLENFYDKVAKNGVCEDINYEGVGTLEFLYIDYYLLNDFLKKIKKKVIKFPFYNRPSYIIK